jgi:hypothetical protein
VEAIIHKMGISKQAFYRWKKKYGTRRREMYCNNRLGALPWFRCRFTLRSPLPATTLVALVLGLVVWANSK